MAEFSPQEQHLLLWMLGEGVRDTTLISVSTESTEAVVTCGECGETGRRRADIAHSPGCDVAPLWALYDRLELEWE